MTRVLFVCVHNASRSQMAEAFFNRLAPAGMRAASAGTDPGEEVNPVVVEAMAEVGVTLQGRAPKRLTPELVRGSKPIITMGCGVDGACPLFLGVPIDEDWDLPDPYGKGIEVVRPIREDIQRRVRDLIRRLGGKPAGGEA